MQSDVLCNYDIVLFSYHYYCYVLSRMLITMLSYNLSIGLIQYCYMMLIIVFPWVCVFTICCLYFAAKFAVLLCADWIKDNLPHSTRVLVTYIFCLIGLIGLNYRILQRMYQQRNVMSRYKIVEQNKYKKNKLEKNGKKTSNPKSLPETTESL